METPRRAEHYLRWKWLVGIPLDIWFSHERLIESIIKEYKLKPVQLEHLGVRQSKEMLDIDRITGIRGGRKIPHLHYKGDLYILDSIQWKEFSSKIVKEFSEKLEHANTVSFNKLVELAEAIGPMP